MNLTYLTDDQVLELYEEIRDAFQLALSAPPASGFAHSQTEHVRFKLRAFGMTDIPESVKELYAEIAAEKKDRQF